MVCTKEMSDMHTTSRYRSPYRRSIRQTRPEPSGGDSRERFIVQGIACGVILAALLAAVVVDLPFTDRALSYVANQLRQDYTQSLPLGHVTDIFGQVRYFVFGDLPETEELSESEHDFVPFRHAPAPPVSAAPAILSSDTVSGDGSVSKENRESNAFYELGEEERLFIEDIINQIQEKSVSDEENLLGESETSLIISPESNNSVSHAPAPAISPGSARVTSKFGYRTNPVTGESELHNGVDMAFAHGSPVAAISDGVVTEVGYNSFSGNYLRYMTSDGLLVGYAHLDRVNVEPGDILRMGDIVALSGSSGLSTGPHLHVTIWRDGISIDPLTVFAEPYNNAK